MIPIFFYYIFCLYHFYFVILHELYDNMSIRDYDEHCERIISQFLDKHFYPNLRSIQTYERISTKDLQVKGVDTIITCVDGVHFIDEKAAVKYINLETFALELSFFNRFGKLCTGWLLDKTKINDYFLFVWINKLNHEKIVDISSIKDIDVALVKKERIIDYLTTLGWTLDKLERKIHQIREQTNVNMGNIKQYGCKFAYSQQLIEKPINILLPKQKYIELADIHQRIIVY